MKSRFEETELVFIWEGGVQRRRREEQLGHSEECVRREDAIIRLAEAGEGGWRHEGQNVKKGAFVQMPRLHSVAFRLAFVGLQRVDLKNAGSRSKVEEIGVARKMKWGMWLPWVLSSDELERLSVFG